MTFVRPFRMSWLIVGISAFQHDRRQILPAAAETSPKEIVSSPSGGGLKRATLIPALDSGVKRRGDRHRTTFIHAARRQAGRKLRFDQAAALVRRLAQRST